jgi:hypothetical protein
VHRGHAEAAQPADEVVARVEGVDGAQFGLDRRGALELILVVRDVEQPAETHRRVRVDQAGRDDRGAQHRQLRRRRQVRRPPHLLDLAVPHVHRAVDDRLAGHRHDQTTEHHERVRRGRRRRLLRHQGAREQQRRGDGSHCPPTLP